MVFVGIRNNNRVLIPTQFAGGTFRDEPIHPISHFILDPFGGMA